MARPSSPVERSPSRTVSPAGFRRITLAVLVTQVIIVLTGAAVRLTGSGLGCSDWPNCEEDRFVPATDFNAVIEFVNRLMSFPVLVAVVLAVWAAGRRVPFRSDLRTLSWAILGGVVVQVLLGAVVVRLELLPSTVIVHFLISMGLIALAVVLHHRAGSDLPRHATPGGWRPTASTSLMIPLALMSAAVLAAGTVVTAAGPHGGDENADRLPVFLPTATRVHSLAAWAFLALLVVVLVLLRRERAPQVVHRCGTIVLVTCLIQGGIGYLQYWNGVPAGLVFLHVAGAMAVWGTTLWFVLEHRRLASTTTTTAAATATAGSS
ncbi:MAG TPA: COX15/CtaA family protein [Actinomycetota bacterium]